MKAKRVITFILAAILLLGCASVLIVGTRAEESNILSVGKKYTVTYETSIDSAFPARAYQDEDKLTDGKIARSASTSDGAFLKLYRGMAAYVTIDLESVCAVSDVSVHFLQQKAAGVYAPRYFKVAVSEDGKQFATVGTLDDPKTIVNPSSILVEKKIDLDASYKARYVRVMMATDCYVFCDEVTVFGAKDAGNAKSASADAPVEDRGYAKKIDGIGNVVLMYTVTKFKPENLKPYVVYSDPSGESKDTMFDSMLFLPSGASNYDYSKDEGWQTYIEELFGDQTNTNLSALNTLIGELISEKLLPEGTRYPVFIALPAFTDYVGKNVMIYGFKPNNRENRLAIIRSFVDQIIGDFRYKNIELKGFYWHEEVIRYSVTDYEEDLIRDFNDYVHEKGKKSIWIPYYCSPGYERAVDLGFDAATLQSGYAFARNNAETGEVQAGAVDDSAASAKKYGLGMEFEVDIYVKDFYKRYLKYLTVGYRTGCMTDGMMMLYHGGNGLTTCASSAAGSEQRQIYDLTYQYIKGTFTSEAPAIQPGQVIVTETGKRQSGNLVITDADSGKNALKVSNVSYSDGLTCVVEGDGFYLVNTSKMDPGVYTITLTVTDGYNDSEEETVYVLVKDAEQETIKFVSAEKLDLYESVSEKDQVGATLPINSEIDYYAKINDDWYYIESGESNGFVKAENIHPPIPVDPSDLPSLPEESKPERDSGLPVGALVGIIAGAVVLLGAAAAVILIKKRKK